ncbi:hypothetical protein F4780DRAFT_574428 [Xylariomycetidae sp. FL0641]|nr:hypothetical protein F4780DRAFT_574428 [Xylariomycetidae sp. FL0641]
MPFDDEDPVALSSSSSPASTNPRPNIGGGGGDDDDDADDALAGEDTAQDFRMFAASLSSSSSITKKKSAASSKSVRRGEKDFEAHGTRAQEGVLETSRNAMHEVLSYTRTHRPRGEGLRGWYFPLHWEDAPVDDEELAGTKGSGAGEQQAAPVFARDRVVVLDADRGSLLQTTGRVPTGPGVDRARPGANKTWLLPEEALYLLERGSLDLWWPARGIEDVFPPASGSARDSGDGGGQDKALEDYELGVPLSLQAAYALLVGRADERGKIPLEKYQVYAHLRRTGYRVLRAPPVSHQPASSLALSAAQQSLWQWLVSLLSSSSSSNDPNPNAPPYGPLVRPGLYRSYAPVFAQLALVPRHRPSPSVTPPHAQAEPFRVHFHVWPSTGPFTKTRPPAPSFRIAVVDARASDVPTLAQMDALVGGAPWDPPPPAARGGRGGGGAGGMGQTYRRLKHGTRSAIVAVVDGGLVSYLRFAETAFGDEKLYERFGGPGGRGGKRGGRNAGRGRGRGRGRGG